MAATVAEKGLAATTIADVARHAGTSKRTFYEHYADKTACYLSLFATRSAAMVAQVDAALRPGELPATVQLADAARTFLDVVTTDPVLGRGHLSELATLGKDAARVRREVVDRNAASILERSSGPAPMAPPCGGSATSRRSAWWAGSTRSGCAPSTPGRASPPTTSSRPPPAS